MEDKSSFGIIGLIIIGVLIFLAIKFFWWIFIIAGILLAIFIVFLVLSSKKSKGEGGATELEKQIRDALSNIRQQKFKAENKINRLQEWSNDAIYTTYSSFFGDKYAKVELTKKYDEIKTKYASQLSEPQVDKTEQIVNSYINHISAEKAKIETLDNLQKEHEDLREKLKTAKRNQQNTKKLDKHVNRINAASEDLQGEEAIIKADFSLDDLKNEVMLNQEYLKQLDELSSKYGDNIQSPQVSEYHNQLLELKQKIKD